MGAALSVGDMVPVPSNSPPLYSVRHWNDYYESSETRKLRSCRFVYTPNKHDGSGFGRMMAHPEGERLFAAWNAIIQVASKMPKRGVLRTSPDASGNSPGVPGDNLTASDLAFRTRLKQVTFEMALTFFSSKEMGWLDVDPPNSEENQHLREIPGNSPEASGETGAEGKGIEGNGKEDQDAVFGIENPQEGKDMGKKKEAVDQAVIPPYLAESPDFMEAWKGFLDMRVTIKRPATDYAQKLLLKKLARLSESKIPAAIEILEESITKNWQDIYPVKKDFGRGGRGPGPQQGEDEMEFLPTGEAPAA